VTPPQAQSNMRRRIGGGVRFHHLNCSQIHVSCLCSSSLIVWFKCLRLRIPSRDSRIGHPYSEPVKSGIGPVKDIFLGQSSRRVQERMYDRRLRLGWSKRGSFFLWQSKLFKASSSQYPIGSGADSIVGDCFVNAVGL